MGWFQHTDVLSLAHFVFLKNFVPTFKNWKLSHKNPDFPHLLEKSPHSHIIISCRHFPGGPVVKTLSSQCRGPRFNRWSGNYIPHTTKKKKKKKNSLKKNQLKMNYSFFLCLGDPSVLAVVATTPDHLTANFCITYFLYLSDLWRHLSAILP